MVFGGSNHGSKSTSSQFSRNSESLHGEGGVTVVHSLTSIADNNHESEKEHAELHDVIHSDYSTDTQDKPRTALTGSKLENEKNDGIQENNLVEYGKVDSAYSWVIVVCASFNLMCTLGVTNSFGVFSTYYINYIFPGQESTIAWVGTMITSLMLGGAVITGPLTNRFGFRIVSLTGSVICCLGLIIASFTSELWHLILTQGIMFGLGTSLIFSPSVSLPAQWHDKHRALAIGITVAGSGAGGMIFTQITQSMMESIGHKWTLRVLGLIVLVVSGSASLFYKHRIPPPKTHGGFWSIAKDPRLICMGMCGFFINASYFVPWYYIPTAALQLGVSKQDANNLVLYMNAGSTVGRIAAAYFAIAVGSITSVAIAYFICAVLVIISMIAVKSMVVYIVLAVIYGGLSASFVSINPLILSHIFGPQSVTTSMGIMNAFCACGVLVGNPSQGKLYQIYDRPHEQFTAIAIWGFVGLFCGSLSYVTLKFLVIRGTKNRIWSRV